MLFTEEWIIVRYINQKHNNFLKLKQITNLPILFFTQKQKSNGSKPVPLKAY